MKDLIFTTSEPFLYIAFWAFLVSVGSIVVVSLLTPPEPPEKIEGLVFTFKKRESEAEK